MSVPEDISEPTVTLPPSIEIDDILDQPEFLLEGEHGNIWHEHRSSTLFVTFDNLATLDDPYPRLPWMHSRVKALGYSLLGVQSFRKDWFRHPTSPAQICALEKRGFFKKYDRIVFLGASMGAFAALNFAPLVPEVWVLAFSPQSTMNKTIAPFENRFQYAVKRSNWEGMPFLDAAAAMPYIRQCALFYDPYEPIDKAHAERLRGDNVQMLACSNSTHQAIRQVVKSNALPEMMQEFAETGRLGPGFWKRMRARKASRPYRRALIETLKRRNHPKLLLRACNFMLSEKDYKFAREARSQVLEEHPELKAYDKELTMDT